MSLRPTAIAQEIGGVRGLFVVIDDPECATALLVPISFEHRRVIDRDQLANPRRFELHPAQQTKETYTREQLLSDGVEAIAKRRWEHAQSAGPFAALGASWEQVRRDPSKWEQRDKYLVPARRDVETALDAIDDGKGEATDGD